MKIRIKNNAVRLRLTRPEVERFGVEKYLEEQTLFPGATFIYAIQYDDQAAEMTADFSNNKITIRIPTPIAQVWVHSGIVSHQHHMDLGNGEKLFLLLEKDFKCIDGDVTEDQSDNYEHPTLSCN